MLIISGDNTTHRISLGAFHPNFRTFRIFSGKSCETAPATNGSPSHLLLSLTANRKQTSKRKEDRINMHKNNVSNLIQLSYIFLPSSPFIFRLFLFLLFKQPVSNKGGRVRKLTKQNFINQQK